MAAVGRSTGSASSGGSSPLAEGLKKLNDVSSAFNMMKWLGILAIGLLILMYCQNKEMKDKQKEQDKKLEKLLQQDRIQGGAEVIPQGGAVANPGANSGTNSNTCGRENAFTYSTGDCSKTCAAQTFRECSSTEYCKNSQWARSSDRATCCSSECLTRVQASLIIDQQKNKVVIVERVDSEFIVWYGSSSSIGYSEYVRAVSTGNGRYSFEIPNDRIYSFTVTRNENTILEVRPG